jgi:hypothetical protein
VIFFLEFLLRFFSAPSKKLGKMRGLILRVPWGSLKYHPILQMGWPMIWIHVFFLCFGPVLGNESRVNPAV